MSQLMATISAPSGAKKVHPKAIEVPERLYDKFTAARKQLGLSEGQAVLVATRDGDLELTTAVLEAFVKMATEGEELADIGVAPTG